MMLVISSRSSTAPIFTFFRCGRMSKMPPNGGVAVARTVTASVVCWIHSTASSKSLVGSIVWARSLPISEEAQPASISRTLSYSMIL